MAHFYVPLGLLLPLLAGVPAPHQVESPKGPAPQLYPVGQLDGNKAVLSYKIARWMPVTEEQRYWVPYTVNGNSMQMERKIMKHIQKRVEARVSFAVDLEKVSATDAFGLKLTRDAVLQLLAPGKTVAMTRDPNGLSPDHRATLAPDVIILIVPPDVKVPLLEKLPVVPR